MAELHGWGLGWRGGAWGWIGAHSKLDMAQHPSRLGCGNIDRNFWKATCHALFETGHYSYACPSNPELIGWSVASRISKFARRSWLSYVCSMRLAIHRCLFLCMGIDV